MRWLPLILSIWRNRYRDCSTCPPEVHSPNLKWQRPENTLGGALPSQQPLWLGFGNAFSCSARVNHCGQLPLSYKECSKAMKSLRGMESVTANEFLRPSAMRGVFLIGDTYLNQTVPNIRVRVGEPYAATTERQDCCSSSTTTTTRAFLDILRAARPEQQLVFQLDEAPLLAAGYHVTELKAVT